MAPDAERGEISKCELMPAEALCSPAVERGKGGRGEGREGGEGRGRVGGGLKGKESRGMQLSQLN